MVSRFPWLLLSIAGMIALPWIARGRVLGLLAILAAMIAGHCVLFFAYVDLLPSGLWRYHNIHYFKWVLPGAALIGFVFLRALLTDRRRPAGIVLAVVLLISAVRLDPRRTDDMHAAWMVQVPGPRPSIGESYYGHFALADESGPLVMMRDYRAMPDGQGWRLIALSRPFRGQLVAIGPGPWPIGSLPGQIRWRLVIRPGLPCWIAGCGSRLPAS